ncbi:MAG TPA: GNAT family N-acetyltransferase [Methanomassiliicoccaceae archaeon]|nr:GNAT family N-acetyltransferase [Methanomassiliicoccaceae archaeon]
MVHIVPVDAGNAERYVELVEALANFENLDPPGEEGRARLISDASSADRPFHAFLAMVDGVAVGYVTFLFTYTTFLARRTLFLEDIFVLEEYRGRGIGTKLFRFCVDEAKREGCGRMEWAALGWNEPAHWFYEGFGAKRLDWYLFRLSGDDLDAIQ